MNHFKAIVRIGVQDIAAYYGDLAKVRRKAAKKERQWLAKRTIDGRHYGALIVNNWGTYRPQSESAFMGLSVTVTMARKGSNPHA